jgi:hypothetical protein
MRRSTSSSGSLTTWLETLLSPAAAVRAERLAQAAEAGLEGGADQRGRRVALEHDGEGGLLADRDDHHAGAAEGDQELLDRGADGGGGDDHAAHGLGDVGGGGEVEGAALVGLVGAVDGRDQRAAHAGQAVELLQQRGKRTVLGAHR